MQRTSAIVIRRLNYVFETKTKFDSRILFDKSTESSSVEIYICVIKLTPKDPVKGKSKTD